MTPGFQLVSLNAKTGHPIPGFGKHGIVDMFTEVEDKRFADLTGAIGNSSPPVISTTPSSSFPRCRGALA